jgi:hypothetical protein
LIFHKTEPVGFVKKINSLCKSKILFGIIACKIDFFMIF